MITKTEQALAKLLKNGDMSAYEQLYKKLFDEAVFYLSKSFDLSKNDAYDIVSSVFARLPEIIDKYDSTQDFLKWFHTVVNNSARDFIKKESRSVPIEPDSLTQHITDVDWGSEKAVEQMECAARLRQIIEGLSDKQYTATTLHYLQGLTVSETAERMKLKPATVKEHLARAKKVITKKVKLEGDHTHWLGGLIPKIGLEITGKLEFLANMGGETKAAIATIAAVTVVSGAALPAHITDVKPQAPQYVITPQEIAEVMPPDIAAMPTEQEYTKPKRASIPKAAQEKPEAIAVESPAKQVEAQSIPQVIYTENSRKSDENRDREASAQVSIEAIPNAVTPSDTEAQADTKSYTKTFYITDYQGNVVHSYEIPCDENGNLTERIVVVGTFAMSREQMYGPDGALPDDRLEDSPELYDENGNLTVSIKNVKKSKPNNDNFEQEQDTTEAESEVRALPEEASHEPEPEAEITDELAQDAQAPSPDEENEEPEEAANEPEPVTEDYADDALNVNTP